MKLVFAVMFLMMAVSSFNVFSVFAHVSDGVKQEEMAQDQNDSKAEEYDQGRKRRS